MSTTLCECGCGGLPRAGNHFLHGHNGRGARNTKWRGGRTDNRGYVFVRHPEHPRANQRGYVPEHILVAEAALGRFIEQPNEVHHVNGDRGDNRSTNLVVCEDRAYHLLLHVRAKALAACGNPDWRPCTICKEYDDPAMMAVHIGYKGRSDRFTHHACNAGYSLRRYHARKVAA